MKCGSFNDLVGVDSECDSWVLETIHGVVSGSATFICSVGQVVKTLLFHGSNMSSILIRSATGVREQMTARPSVKVTFNLESYK